MENAQPVCNLTVEVVFSVRINRSLVERERKKKCCALKRCQMFSSSEITVATRSSIKRPNNSSQGQASEAKKQCTVSTPVIQKEVSVYDFLKDNGRKVHMVKGDGNCLFRSMSYELFKTEEHHNIIKVCNNVVWLISCNREEFSSFNFQSIVPQYQITL